VRFREEREHEACPHCGRNACSWHMPGRFCVYAYEDLPGQVKKRSRNENGPNGGQTVQAGKESKRVEQCNPIPSK
jgi:hypothetical protein